MNPELFRRATELYEVVRTLSLDERAAILDEACQGDGELRAQVESLLEHQQEPTDFRRESELKAKFAEQSMTVDADRDLCRLDSRSERIGAYRILEEIGQGGMGIVYLAEQREPIRRRVALKVIKLGLDTKEVIARFEAEQQALAILSHVNIARVYEAGATENGRPYFAMEYVQGTPITTFCDRHKVSVRERLKLLQQVCHGIHHAHLKGIIHRDLKPSNILVTNPDGDPVAKIIDFGVAKATNQRLTEKTIYTELGRMIGTPAYMSPEQAEMSAEDVDNRTDIYSLGVLLYEILVGELPLDEEVLRNAAYDEVRRRICEEEPPTPATRLSRLNAERSGKLAASRSTDPKSLTSALKGDLDWITMKCLEKERDRRYATATELAADIERHLGDETVLAGPPSMAYKFQKFARKNRGPVKAAAAVFLALTAGLIVSLLFYGEARRSSTLAVREAERNRRQLYVARMNLAQEAWEQKNVGRVEQLLEETATYPEKGFEWYYWQRQTHRELKTLRGHTGVVFGVAFSPDGQRIITGSLDHTAVVWDADTGRRLRTLSGHGSWIHAVAYSPDGQRILTGSWDHTARVWEAASGRELFVLKGHDGAIRSVAFSPDGQRIVTGSRDHTAKVWDATSGEELLILDGLGGWTMQSVTFSPDGRWIATGSELGQVWDATSGRELLVLKGHDRRILSVAFSPDGRRIVTGSRDNTAKVWDATSGEELLTLEGHTDQIFSVAYSPDGKHIVTASADETARIWESASGEALHTLKGHDHWIWSVAFSPDGQRIVTGSRDNTAKVWDVPDRQEPLTLTGHGAGINSVTFSPDGHRIVTGSDDYTARMWEAASGKELYPLEGHGAWIGSVAFSPDGRRVVTSGWDQTARIWEAASGRELLRLKGHDAWVSSAAFSPDGQRVVTGSGDRTARVWDATSGRTVLNLAGHKAGIFSVAFSPDGQRIVTGSGDQTAKVWDVDSGKVLLSLEGHTEPIRSVAFSPDGRRIVTGSEDSTAKVWDATSGRELFALLGHSGPVKSVAFSPDGRRIVTGSEDKSVKVWEATSGGVLLTLRGGHEKAVNAVAFSPDGQRVAAGSGDRTVKVWYAASPEQVAAWDTDRRASERTLADVRQEQAEAAQRAQALRKHDAGAIKKWLLLAPITIEEGSDAAALEQEFIPGEAELRPTAGQRERVAANELVWRALHLEDYFIDFNLHVGKETNWSVAYAVCYIQSETDQTGLSIKVGSDDQSKVYLNGKAIYSWDKSGTYMADHHEEPDVSLKAGLNVLVFKVVNRDLGWAGSVRFTDKEGKPVNGLTVTLDPDA